MKWRAANATVLERPLVVTFVIAALFALGHAWWLWTHRRMGAFDPDEAGYLADALRFHAALSDGPGALLAEIRSISTAPLVPLLSVLLLVIGPDDPRTAMLVQPLLMVLTTVCIAAITDKLVGPRMAVAAALAFLCFPATIHAAQAYHYGLPAAAAMALAVLALIHSERGTNRWIWVFGAAVGAMVLFRTMALGFLPAIAAAGFAAAGKQPRGLRRVILALLLAVAIAAPWYVLAREGVFGYLFNYGYGERSNAYGAAGMLGRLVAVPLDAVLSAGAVLPTIVLIAATWTGARSIRELGFASTVRRVLADPDRRALFVLTGVGFAALLSTANQGGWFVYPLFCGLVPLGAEVLERSAVAWQRLALTALLTLGPILAVSGWWLVPYGAVVPLPSAYETGFARQDPRFEPDRRPEQTAAAQQWDRAHREVIDVLHSYRTDRGAVFTVSGSTPLVNSNNLALAALLEGWDTRFEAPDTANPNESWVRSLRPRGQNWHGQEAERILVFVDPHDSRFPAEANSDALQAEALRRGWTVTDVIDLPVGGAVRILRHG